VTIMNRSEREELIEQLLAENAVMLTDNAIRKARSLASNEPRYWKTPEPEPRPEPEPKLSVDDVSEAVREYVVCAIEAICDELGPRTDRKIDQKIAGLNTEIGELRAQVTLLEGLLRGAVINLPKGRSDAA